HGRSLDADERALVKLLGIDDGGIYVGEDLEFVGYAEIVSVRGDAVGNHAFTHLAVVEWIDHSMFLGHAADPAVTFNCHSAMGSFRFCGDFGVSTKSHITSQTASLTTSVEVQ